MLQGIDTIRPGLGPQVQKAFLQNQSQFQLSPQQQQQQIMAQVQGQGNMTNSSMYGDMDSRRFTGLPRGNLNSKDGQQNANDGSIGSPMLSNSSKVRFFFLKNQQKKCISLLNAVASVELNSLIFLGELSTISISFSCVR